MEQYNIPEDDMTEEDNSPGYPIEQYARLDKKDREVIDLIIAGDYTKALTLLMARVSPSATANTNTGMGIE